MVQISNDAENSIPMAFVVMSAEKIRRLLRLFFHYLCLYYACQRPGALWMALRSALRVETQELLVTE